MKTEKKFIDKNLYLKSNQKAWFINSQLELTDRGWVDGAKQVGDEKAFRFFNKIDAKFFGSASISNPDQSLSLSKNKVFERVSPSKAPHSI